MRFGSIGAAATVATVAVLVAVSACSPWVASPATSARPDPTAPFSPSPGPSHAVVVRDLARYALPQAGDLFRGAAIAALAGGPAGFVVLGNDRASGALISWTSTDGDGWVRHWLPGRTFGGGTPGSLVGGSFGYLAVGWKVDGATVPRALWSSPDGVSWALAPAAGLPGGELTTLVSGPAGAAATFDLRARGAAVATSRDGRSWTAATLPDGGFPGLDGVVPLPDGFLVRGWIEGKDPAGQPTATDTAWRTRDGVTWTADRQLGKKLADLPNSIEDWQVGPFGTVGVGNDVVALVSVNGLDMLPLPPSSQGRLVGGPAGLLWVQRDDGSTGCPSASAAWQYVSDGWRPLAEPKCPSPASGMVLGSASIADAMLIIGYVESTRDPIASLVRAAGSPPAGTAAGGPIATAPAEAIPDPLAATIVRAAACPSPPATIESALALDPRAAVGCFGAQTMSFRAWVVDPGEGYGGTCAAFTPQWIRECVLPDYLLAAAPPVNSEQPRLHAMRAPKATGALNGVGRWVQIQGHYDDPVSPSCRGSGGFGSISLESEMPPALAVLDCRLVFVVTDIRTAK